MRANPALLPKFKRFCKTHWMLFTALLCVVSMQSLMMLLTEIGESIMTTGFEQSQWVHPVDRVLVQEIPSSVFWHYIQQEHGSLSRRFAYWVGKMLSVQFPLVLSYIGLGRWRKWQQSFALMLWAWPIATPFVGFTIYRHQTPTRQKFLVYLSITINCLGISCFALATDTTLQVIGQVLTFLVAAIWFMLCGTIYALIHAPFVLSGRMGMVGEADREGLSYGLAVIGYFELFWIGLWLKQRLHKRST
jgi:hypothetical protein